MNVIRIIFNFIRHTETEVKNIMVSFADRCCTQARGVVGMDTKRKVSTATAVLYGDSYSLAEQSSKRGT